MRFARARHAGQHREIDHAPFITHPIEVGCLLHGDGQPDEIIAAGLLHDVLEKTATTSAELQRRFGAHIARLVESVSDDPSIGDYKSRKRELRDRVAHATPTRARSSRRTRSPRSASWRCCQRGDLDEPKIRAKLAHYRASLEMLRRVDGDAPPRRSSRRRAQPTRRTRGQRSSQRGTDHERHRLEAQQLSNSHDLKDVVSGLAGDRGELGQTSVSNGVRGLQPPGRPIGSLARDQESRAALRKGVLAPGRMLTGA